MFLFILYPNVIEGLKQNAFIDWLLYLFAHLILILVQDTFMHKNYIISIILSICLSRIKKVHTFYVLNLERY